MLTVENLEVLYGRVRGTTAVNLNVNKGEMVALVGSNGAGKSSTLKAILGLVTIGAGRIAFDGQDLSGEPPSKIIRNGIGYSPEGRRVFTHLTVEENLRVGGFTRSAKDNEERMAQIHGYFPILLERRRQLAGNLSGGEQQMLAIGRALMSRPKLFLLDEPSLGLAPIVVERIGDILLEIQAKEGLAVILAEQNAYWALSVANRGVILELGSTGIEGKAADLLEDPRIRSAYLGI
ncbi:MAG: ABC transporter ATP-binding protein [Verrucomicrobiaceae bacterium]